jgi:hypothetical protein
VFGAPVADRSAVAEGEVSVLVEPGRPDLHRLERLGHGASSADVTDVAVPAATMEGAAPGIEVDYQGTDEPTDFDPSRYLRRQRARRPGAASLGIHLNPSRYQSTNR